MNEELERAGEGCGCLPWLIWITAVIVGAALLFGIGSEVYTIGDVCVLGSWLAIPGGMCAAVGVVLLAPWMFRMKI